MKQILFTALRWLFTRPSFANINRKFFHLAIRNLGILNYENDAVSGEGWLIAEFLPNNILGECPVIFDVGANVGRYSEKILAQIPATRLFAFEPHPKTFDNLKKRLLSRENVCLINSALGSKSSTLTLYDQADSDGSSFASLYQEVITGLHQKEYIGHSVEVLTIDGFCDDNCITRIDWLKIDTEGNELAVLQGCKRMISEARVELVHFEFNEMNVVSRVFFRDFQKVLPGWSFFRLLPRGLLPLGDSPIDTELFAYQNIICIPNGKHRK